MEQRTQPAVHAAISSEELLVPPRTLGLKRPRLAWAVLMLTSLFLGAQLPELSLVREHRLRLDAESMVAELEAKAAQQKANAPIVAAQLAARRAFEQRLESNSHFIVGERMLTERELEGAKVRAAACAESDPTNPRCPALLGRIYEETKDHALATQEYFKAVHLAKTPEEREQISARFGGLRPETARDRF